MDRLQLPILHQDLLPTPLLLLPPVHRWTHYTCPYYTKTFCHTPYCSSLLFTDGHITPCFEPTSTKGWAPGRVPRVSLLNISCPRFQKNECPLNQLRPNITPLRLNVGLALSRKIVTEALSFKKWPCFMEYIARCSLHFIIFYLFFPLPSQKPLLAK